ncbi:hypothetical protein DPMN_150253 [Dreissena polymorpha]|uniref:Uncharacterized protein n=1 Tax=Dreissena polymorpha TaxID=45954 RepID=A0A9D4J5H1_DREPO|nr:hypothetical protein DPMN_150253 [Dreissena polymorpha]
MVISSAAHNFVVIIVYTVSSAHHGRHRVLYRQQRAPWSSSRVISSASHAMVVIEGYTVSTAYLVRHR